MPILLAFLPVAAFIVFERMAGSHIALLAAAALAAGLTLTNIFVRRTGAKILDLGSMTLFCGLAAYVQFSDAWLPLAAVRLVVDYGFVAIVLISILIRRPFTLQYVSRDRSGDPRVLRAHYAISSAWAAAFAAMAGVDVIWIMHPGLRTGLMLATTALSGTVAFRFTRWYPRHLGLRSPTSRSA